MSDIAKRIGDLSPEKLKHLLQRTRQKSTERSQRIVPHIRDSHDFPLSFAQQRLWFLYQWEPNSPLYNVPLSMHLTGRLQVQALEQAIHTLVQRHEVLRTIFTTINAQPVQVIMPSLTIPLAIVNLEGLPEPIRTRYRQRLTNEESQRPFDLLRGPLLRVHLLRLSSEEHTLLLTMHHIVSDGWSLRIFVRELTLLYVAFSSGMPSPLSNLPLQYIDYAIWQREWLQGEILERQLAYWKRQLDGTSTVLELPTNRPRPPMQTFRGSTYPFSLPQSLSEGLKLMSIQQEVTLFMTLLAAWQILLSRYTGQEDFLVGTPIANRTHRDIESIMGCFVNTLVLRSNLAGNPSFQEFLGRVREMTLDAYAHQDVPFERLVDELHPERELSRSPLFQVMFNFLSSLKGDLTFGDLKLDFKLIDPGVVISDLSLSLWEEEGGIRGICEYNTDLFEEATIGRMVRYFQVLLEQIVIDPTQRVSEFPLLTKAEEHQALVEWNATQQPLQQVCLHQLFEAQVQRTPDAIALAFEDTQLSYQELNERANQLAHYLQELGVGPEELVGICLPRSLDQMIGLLAVLKAGGAYLPLDPAFPAARLAFMLNEARVSVLLTEQAQLPLFEPMLASSTPVLCLQACAALLSQQSRHSPPYHLLPEQLAYMIYTSGSTGTPKGVMISQASLLNYLNWAIQTYKVTQGSGVLLHSSLSFDLSVTSLFPPLLVGQRLVLLPEGQGVEQLAVALLGQPDWSLLKVTPAHLDSLRQLLPAEQLAGRIRTLVIGGEALQREQLVFWQEAAPQMRIFNEYGPSETVVGCSCYELAEDEQGRGAVPIGRPISNMSLYLLDAHRRLVPVGVVGEVYIAGVGVGRGYCQRGELTAERFVPHPYSLEPGERLYRTGDLARYLPPRQGHLADGSIEFVGRIDEQVKLRGYRIELGEIEATLQRHPTIREAVVQIREEAVGDKRLVAYIVAEQGVVRQDEVCNLLAQYLPDYMIPSELVPLQQLPLTPSGKIDRRRLAALEPQRSEERRDEVTLYTPVEEIIAGIWAEVLKREHVRIHDNFFALGGHSLLATQVVARLRDVFQREVPLRMLFEAPTLQGLAQRLERLSKDEQPWITPSFYPSPRQGNLPLSFAQQRLWFLDQLEPARSIYNILMALHLSGRLNVAALQQSINEIVRRHEALRTTFVTIDGEPAQVIAPHGSVRLPVIDLERLPALLQEEQARWLVREEGIHPFDLARGPLLRAWLVRVDHEEQVLLVTMHHIVSDGWSLGVFLRELGGLYAAYLAGESSALPALPLQYADYALWQRDYLHGHVLATHLAYWQEQLAGAPLVLELPTDRPRPAVQTFQGATLSFALPHALSQALHTLSQREGVTLFMLLLAAWATLLARSSGQDDLLVGTPIANRTHAPLEPLIGFFVNTLVLRCDLSGNPRFVELLRRVRETCLGAYAHQDLPFEQLVEALQPQRDLSHSPLFQVMFILQNAPMPALELPGLHAEPLAVEQTTAKFELTLMLQETTQGLHAVLEYNRDLFEPTTITRMAEHYQLLLEAIVATPEQSLARLPLLTPEEREHLLQHGNQFQHRSAAEQVAVPHLFEAQARLTPDAIALVSQADHLTYGALNRGANRLATQLRALGVGPEVLVALLATRNNPFVLALLAIWKAAGCYLPLDPAQPPARLRQVLSESGAGLVLVSAELAPLLTQVLAGLPASQQPQVLMLEHLLPVGQPQPQEEENLQGASDEQQLAYVLYTSGSTGIPKGVMVQQAGMRNHLFAKIHALQLTAEDRVAQTASQGFVISVWQMLAPLLVGGRLQIFPDEVSHDPGRLLAEVERYGVSILEIVPSMLAAMLAVLADVQPARRPEPPLRWLIPTGEALAPALLERWFACYAHIPLLNAYGPTECSDDVAHYLLTEPLPAGAVSTPIGRPVQHMQLYVLDGQLNLLPIGVVGELYVGGVGVGRGYLKDAGRTAEVFVANPYSQQPGGRLYRTGDLARYRSDGTLEFLGRRDQQVKIRGHRIELGEIEAVLRQHPSVQTCAVVLTNGSQQHRGLVGYVVADLPRVRMSELRHWLGQRLPDYMIPSLLVPLEQLPLSPNGKVDRRNLSALQLSRIEQEEENVAPRSPLEEIVSTVWRQVLRVERVGVHDHFFALGGHSLLATQVVARLRDILQIEIPLRLLFEEPTTAKLTQRIEQLAPDKQATPTIVLMPRVANLPLSFAQQRLWFLDQLEGNSPFYNLPLAMRLQGVLLLAALEQSLNEIVQRHEALRTTFPLVAGEPAQCISSELQVRVPVVDIAALPESQRQAHIQRLVREEAISPFDLARGPLLRAWLVRVDREEQVLLVTMHHIVSDGWSLGVFLRELAGLYAAYLAGESSPLPLLPLQYADYALWQRDYLQAEVLERHLAYWQQQLAGAPLVLELPTDRPRPAVQTFQGATLSFTLPHALTQALHTLSQREGVTLFMLLLAAWATLLARYSGQDDLLVGTPIANRTHASLEPLIGFFVNTLVLRCDLSGTPRFVELLRRVREACLGAYAHQDLPFEQLVEALQPQRDLSHSPLFQVMFILQNAPIQPFELPGLHIEPLVVEQSTAKFELTLMLQETTQGLQAVLEYNRDLFEPATITRMAEHYQLLLEGIVATPEQRVAHLPLLTPEERHLLLHQWNPSLLYPDAKNLAVSHPFEAQEEPSQEMVMREAEEQPVAQLFEAQVERTPDGIALASPTEQLTYAALNQGAHRLAAQLHALGVGPEVLVALLATRGNPFVLALLAIWKAAGCYLPLDPAQPPVRLRQLLSESGAGLLLVSTELAPLLTLMLQGLPASQQPQVLVLEHLLQQDQREEEENLQGASDEQQLAYVLYTSGSTGIPKGVMVQQAGMRNHLFAKIHALQLTAEDRLAQTASQGFVISVWQMLAPLLVGGRLQIFPDEVSHDPGRLLAEVERYGVSILEVVPSMLAAMLAVLADVQPARRPEPSLRWLIPTGEALAPALVERWFTCYPHIPLLNAYGPTECSDDVAHGPLTEPLPAGAVSTPIGRPVQNMQLYVLDGQLSLLPIGVVGELYVGGVGVGRGYLKDAGRTAEVFVANPYSQQPGGRLYRSGDLARYRSDGTLEFLGRRDQQVKIRGHRIELGEIEAVLRQHPSVQEVVVLAHEEKDGNKRLVTYLLLHHTKTTTTSDLYSYLKEMLPTYMLPSAFIFLDAFPRSPNGKLDRRRLPSPDNAGLVLGEAYEPPRNPIEELLVSIWTDVLRHEHIGIHDNFFELGGHSLLATQVISRVRETFQVELPLRALFHKPTVMGLAEALVKHEAVAGQVEAIAQLRKKIDAMSLDEVRQALQKKKKERGSL